MRRAGAFLILLLAACTPRIEPPGEPIMEPSIGKDAIIAADGMRLALESWSPSEGTRPSAVLLALHGFNDYASFFRDAGSWLAERGVAVYAYDQRGFGRTAIAGLWPGKDALVDDVRAAAGLLRRAHPGLPLFLLGDSMGGAVAITAMTAPDPPDVDATILVAPAVWGRESMPWYQRLALELFARSLPWLKLSGSELGLKPSDNIEMLKELGRDPLVIKRTRVDAVHGLVGLMDAALDAAARFDAPALILYGEKDEIIPRKPTIMMLERLPAVPDDHRKVVVFEEGYHMLLRDLDAVSRFPVLLEWMRSR